jgi:hypothetical protein
MALRVCQQMEPGSGCSWAGGGVTVFCETYPVSLIDSLWLTSTFPVKIPVLIITIYNIDLLYFVILAGCTTLGTGRRACTSPTTAHPPTTSPAPEPPASQSICPVLTPASAQIRSGFSCDSPFNIGTSQLSLFILSESFLSVYALPLFSFLSIFSIPSLTLPPPYPIPSPSPLPHPPATLLCLS